MNTHFDWTISHLRKYAIHDGNPDIVYEVGYSLTGINTTGVALTEYYTRGSLQLDTNNITDPVAYSDIRKDNIVAWINQQYPNIEESVIDRLNTSNQSIIKNMPWE